jgi:intracellular proteinase inhibitor BsuPI
MRVMTRLLGVLPILGLTSACGGPPTSPSEGPLALTAQASKTTLAAGESATIVFTLTNTSSHAVQITLPDSCLLLPVVVDRHDGREVDQGGGGIGCAQVISGIVLQPGESRSLTVEVRAADGDGPYIPLRAAGEYWIYAKMHDSVYRLQSAPIIITVG